jgi:hypothetical protein
MKQKNQPYTPKWEQEDKEILTCKEHTVPSFFGQLAFHVYPLCSWKELKTSMILEMNNKCQKEAND